MIVSAISYFIVRYFEPNSIYTKQLVRKGHLIKDKDKALLNGLKLKNLIENDFAYVHKRDTLKHLVEVIALSKRNVFAVLDEKEILLGVVVLDDIREIMFQHENYDTVIVEDLMTQPPATINKDESLYTVMKKFDTYNAWNLPVLEDGKYLGFVSKSKIFTHYRKHLINQSEDLIL
jgi:CIC family chloride channel protein